MAQSRKAALAKLNASRAGEKRTTQYQREVAGRDDRIYDEVDEGAYQKIVRSRLLMDDFVEDDNNMGYADNGEEDWGDNHSTDELVEGKELEEPSPSRLAQGSRGKAKGKSKRQTTVPSAQKTTSAEAYRKPIAQEYESDFMASILNALDNSSLPAPKSTKPVNDRKRKSSPQGLPEQHQGRLTRQAIEHRFQDDPIPSSDMPDGFDHSLKTTKKLKVEHDSSSDFESAPDDGETSNPYDTMLDDDFEDVHFTKLSVEGGGDLVLGEATSTIAKQRDIQDEDGQRNRVSTNSGEPDTKALLTDSPSWLKVLDAQVVESADFDTLGPLGGVVPSTSTQPVTVLQGDGSLRFFWMDYLEFEGKIYLTGKVLDQGTHVSAGKPPRPSWVSCCVIVGGLQRNLFVKPRRLKLDTDDEETDVAPEENDIYSDFDQLRRKCKIKTWMGKFVRRKYVLDDVDREDDREQKYLKVVYGYDEPQIPLDAQSPAIEKVYGTNTSAFELFVMKRKIMGPCWLDISQPVISTKGVRVPVNPLIVPLTQSQVSWCRVEVEVNNPKHVRPFPESDATAPRDMPPLTVMSLSLRTIINHATSQREVVCASARFWVDINPDDPTPPEELPQYVHTVVRCLDKFPGKFEEKARGERSIVHTMKNERALLSSLLTVMKKRDPDVIVGHEFLGVSLDILLHRLKQLKVEPWSSIGRFRRTKWPTIGKQGTNIKFVQGRLLCDLASDAAKSMITSTTWSLTEMCASQLNFNRQEIDPEDTATYFDSTVGSPERLLSFVRHCEMDSYLQMALCAKIQMLPLTKQLTCLAGNSWNKTLNGGRAERNEYILLHEFHRLKFICPDKVWGKKAAMAAIKAEAEDVEQPAGGTAQRSKRDKYKGGLVFEPKRGLWDRYILVMDFNSLYPSIIQEYNIDFTTVSKAEIFENGEEKIPEVPTPETPPGVLPRLIATLVNRRKQVKALMKDPKASAAKLMQWDIKQKALKLTANSMYGCLGFEHSRFYARPLAALTTFKGREILTHTRELAESLQLDTETNARSIKVVYGDTDSVFINSNADSFPEALKMASMLKKHVNDRYKLLEIDLDAVFQRLLLLQKKKYAAIKMEGPDTTSIEIKGLDMKRREFCALSKTVSKRVLDCILSGKPTESVVEEIHDYLRDVASRVRAGQVSLEEVTIYKRLGKNPEEYDAKGQPHVQVALRMKARGGSAKAGDVIPYVFCLGPDSQSSRGAQADRARHPDEVRRGGDDVLVDYEFYICHQVLPPIERLCDPIEGTDRSRIAECLGLDPTKYLNTAISAPTERDFATLGSLIPDKERFREVDPFVVQCQHCTGSFEIISIASPEVKVRYT
ncbi:DNA-directed DNA polymerase alpha catalytic subunit pol1 [Tulasnella sp. 403]|nr:DNA-directed DNA polymerase alpha catalytic subunit pol1 [Tulasnella sp. 403]